MNLRFVALIIAVIIGSLLFVMAMLWIMNKEGCYNGAPISETPNYCLGGR